MIKLLNAATGLRSVSINLGGDPVAGRCFNSDALSFPKLQSLSLSWLHIEDFKFLKLLLTCSSSLKSLRLTFVTVYLTKGCGWRKIFEFLRTELLLRELYLDCIFEVTEVGHSLLEMFSFEAIHNERPFVDERWFDREQPSPSFEEIMALETFSVVNRPWNKSRLSLSEEEGDNLREWIDIVAKLYTTETPGSVPYVP
jgi:hypothetical protein